MLGPLWSTPRGKQKKHCLYPYHFTKVQGLEPGDHATRRDFCHWLLNSDIELYNFLKNILWTDESLFTRQGIFNTHNMYFWADTNPKSGREVSFQRRFNINVWAGVIRNLLLGPHVSQGTLNEEMYWNLLLHDLPRILHEVKRARRQRIVYQDDGAVGYYSLDVQNWLNENYQTWIGRGRTVSWPARSPDLIPMDFFVWGLMKQEVHSTPVNSEDELLNRINAAAVKVREALTFKVTVAPIRKRSRACIRENGGYFGNKL